MTPKRGIGRGFRLTFSVETLSLAPQGIAEKVQDAPSLADSSFSAAGVNR
jgi:hypothetical protein